MTNKLSGLIITALFIGCSVVMTGSVGAIPNIVSTPTNTMLFASSSKSVACSELSTVLNNTNQDCGHGISTIDSLIYKIVNIFSIIVGIVSVIMVVISGLRFIMSGGDSNGVASAKNTLIYALVGLGIAALAAVLVRMTINSSVVQSSGYISEQWLRHLLR